MVQNILWITKGVFMQNLNNGIIDVTVAYVKEELAGAEGGHDWWHTLRVWNLAKRIGNLEVVDLLVVELGALLHDIADSKFYDGDEEIGGIKARSFLSGLELKKETIEHVVAIVRNVSWKGGKDKSVFWSSELAVVQDADRLDALGAIGIGRTFSYGGYKGRELYNPGLEPNLSMTKAEYKNNTSPTINHFYEKLLLLKDGMNTGAGREIAKGRHEYMVDFLNKFKQEWDEN